jgi:ppGpp synthetase/RelA/SpoT-type nucleotidyltranferase
MSPPRRAASREGLRSEDTDRFIADTVDRYRREYDRYAKLAECIADECRLLLEENAIRATVEWRPKRPQGLARKLNRLAADPASATELVGTEDPLALVSDLAAVRIKTYVEADRWKVVEDIQLAFDGPGEGEDVEVDVKDRPDRLYRATHCQVTLRRRSWVGRYANLRGVSCEVQVCSLLAHVWNEIEHELVYKCAHGDVSAEERQLLADLGRITREGDAVLNDLLAANSRRVADRRGAFVDQFGFVTRMRERFPEAANFEMHALPLLGELLAEGLSSPEAIQTMLLREGYDRAWRRLFVEFEAYQKHAGDWGVVLDPDSSDQLLVLLLDRRAPAILRRHQSAKARGRLPRIARLARRFLEMRGEGGP